MSTLKLHNTYGNQGYDTISALNHLEKKEKSGKLSDLAAATDEVTAAKTDSVEISPEGRLAVEQNRETQALAGQEKKTSEDDGLEEKMSKAAGQEEEAQETAGPDAPPENASDSDSPSGKVAVNEGKRARQIAAAKNQAQIQQVLALLHKDLSDCKAGKQKGWCDDSEIAKVEALIVKAQSRISQVPQKSAENDQGGLDAFAMASLM